MSDKQQSGKILIIDDSRTNLSFLSNILVNAGYEVICANNGLDGIREADQTQPHLILLDVDMPEMNGFDVCSRLKSGENTQNIPVIFISAMDEVQDKIRGFESGGVDYITKPFQLEEVLIRVRTHLTIFHLQKEIQEAGHRNWQATFHAVNDAIFLTDVEGKITDCNIAALNLLGLTNGASPRGFIGNYLFHDASEVGDIFTLNGEIQFPLLEGWFDVSSYPLSQNGERSGTVFIIENITEKKQIESRMISSQRMADLGALSAAITHELKSPLQVITWASESLLDRSKSGSLPDGNTHSSLEAIFESSQRINEIVFSLLNYARSSSGGMDPQDLNSIIQDTLRLIEHQLKVWANIQVTVTLEENLPLLVCDRLKISQVFINLLMNARDAMPSGGIINISTSLIDEKNIELDVTDSGTGIAPEIQNKVFDQFFTTKPMGQGTGLGLYIVGSVVQAHGGKVFMESEMGKGTTFKLHFPVQRQEQTGSTPVFLTP